MIYADENVWIPVAEGLRRRGWEVTTAVKAGTLGDSDREHLRFAAEEGWTLLTFDDDFLSMVMDLFLFDSTARGEATGLSSDVDFLAVIADDADRDAVVEALEDAAYDAMLEHDPVVEVHVLTRSEFERRRERGDPLVRRVLHEGRSYG
jgi:predicted nucleotidyltransferase